MLLRLTYASLIAAGRGQSDIDAIVEASSEANRRRGITGVLSFDGEKIIQILEGPAAEVEALFAAILADPRHHGVVELGRAAIDKVHFTDWGMMRRPVADVFMMSQTI